jgi:hypothetical protein
VIVVFRTFSAFLQLYFWCALPASSCVGCFGGVAAVGSNRLLVLSCGLYQLVSPWVSACGSCFLCLKENIPSGIASITSDEVLYQLVSSWVSAPRPVSSLERNHTFRHCVDYIRRSPLPASKLLGIRLRVVFSLLERKYTFRHRSATLYLASPTASPPTLGNLFPSSLNPQLLPFRTGIFEILG